VQNISPPTVGVAEGKAIEVANSKYTGNIVSGGEVLAVSNGRTRTMRRGSEGGADRLGRVGAQNRDRVAREPAEQGR
jgi:hypothetical protein